MLSAAELLPALLVVAAVLGLAVGSFLNVVIHRLPLGLSLSHPGSRCPSCGTPIRARHNVPVFGWLVLRGRCHTCQAPISARYPLVEAGTAVAFVAVVLALVAGARDDEFAVLAPVPAWLWLTASLVAAGSIDLDGHRVPTRFAVLTPTVVAVLLVATGAPAAEWGSLLRALIFGVGLAGVAAVFRRGDAAAAGIGAAVGLALGAVSWPAGAVGFVGSAAVVVAAAVTARRVPVVALLGVVAAVGLAVAAAVGY